MSDPYFINREKKERHADSGTAPTCGPLDAIVESMIAQLLEELENINCKADFGFDKPDSEEELRERGETATELWMKHIGPAGMEVRLFLGLLCLKSLGADSILETVIRAIIDAKKAEIEERRR